MRLSTLSVFASSLLMGASIAWAQTDSSDRPSPPSPTQELPPATDGGVSGGDNTSYMGYPAWQGAPYGAYGGASGYGGWQHGCGGSWEGYGDHCCGGCDNCCKPSLRCRLKALRSRLAAALARCRRGNSCCSDSCCGGGTSCCHGSDTPDFHGDAPVSIEQEAIPAAPQSDLLPVPPPEPSGYDSSSDNQRTSSATQVAKRKYNMPRMNSAKSRKPRR